MFRRFRALVFIVIFALLLSFLFVNVALAKSDNPPPTVPMLTDVLAMLASGVGVGAVIAFLFEKISWFQGMSPSARWWTILGLSIGLPVAAQAALQFIPPEVWAKIEPYWRAVATGFLVWAGSQVAHLYNKRQVTAATKAE